MTDRIDIDVAGLEALPAAARQIVDFLGSDVRVVAFHGEMGAGKTTLIREICRECGVDVSEANSPSFSIINEYASADGPLYHFDLYRLNSPEEGLDIGVEDILYSGSLCLLEWPEMIGPLLPDDAAHLYISETPDGVRHIALEVDR